MSNDLTIDIVFEEITRRSEKVKVKPSYLLNQIQSLIIETHILTVPNAKGELGDNYDDYTRKIQKYTFTDGHNGNDYYDFIRDLTPEENELMDMFKTINSLL